MLTSYMYLSPMLFYPCFSLMIYLIVFFLTMNSEKKNTYIFFFTIYNHVAPYNKDMISKNKYIYI